MGTRTEVTHCLNPLPYNQNIYFIIKEINYIKSIINNIATATGTVKSVGISSNDLNVTNSPITSTGVIDLTLKNVNANVGVFGAQYIIPSISINSKGLITAAENIALPNATSLIKGLLLPQDWINFNDSFNKSIAFLNVSGTSTKTLTLYRQDGGTLTTSWSDIDTAPVSSVFGRIGDVVAQSGDYNTTLVTEGTNLYFTNSRVIGSTLTGYTSGSGTITSSDTVLSALQKLNGNTNALSSVYFPLIGGTVTGTGGNGFIGLPSQGTVPATPSSGFRLYANSSHALSWIGQNGFTRTFDGTSNTANRTYTLPNFDGNFLLTSTTPSSGSVLFGTGTTIGQDNTNFFWDNTNKRLGIGTVNPVSKISAIDAVSGRGVFLDVNTVASHSGIWLGANNLIPSVSNCALLSNGTNLFINRPSGGNIGIRENNTEQVTIFSGGNVGIGTSTNVGFRLDVLGHFRVRVGVSPSLAYETGLLYHGTNYWQYPASNDYIFATRTVAAGNLRFRTNDIDRFVISPIGELSQGAATIYANSSGTTSNVAFSINSTINNTGTYSGIFRGIFYNPTLTSLTGTTHRAIETVVGDVVFGSTSGSVLIGTTTLTGHRLNVEGATRLNGNVLMPINQSHISWNDGTTRIEGNTGGSAFIRLRVAGIDRLGIDVNGRIGFNTISQRARITAVDDQSFTSQYLSNSISILDLVNINTTTNNWISIGFKNDPTADVISAIQTRVTNHTNRYGELHFSTRGASGIASRLIIDESGNCRVTGTLTVGTITITTGTGTPEGTVTAPIGSQFMRTDGGANTTLYVKESGTGNTGWVAK